MMAPLLAVDTASEEPSGSLAPARPAQSSGAKASAPLNCAPFKTRAVDGLLFTLIAVILVVVAALVYSPSTTGAFLLDDENNIVDNPSIRSPFPISKHVLSGMRGLTMLSFAINCYYSGLSVQSYHHVNIAIHCFAAFFLYGWLTAHLKRTRHIDVQDIEVHEASANARTRVLNTSGVAFTVAIVWAVHPLNTQAITYIVQRAESLAGMFFFLFMWLFTSSTNETGKKRALLSVLAWLAVVLGLLCKETMVMAIPIAILFDRTFYSESWKCTLLRRRWLWASFLVPGALLAPKIVSALWAANATGGFSMGGITWWEYVRTQPSIMVHYLRLVLIPYPQCFDYGWPPEPVSMNLIASWCLLGFLIAACIYGIRSKRTIAFWGIAAFLYLLPTTVVPLQDLAAEHRMYVPMALALMPLLMGCGYCFDWLVGRFDLPKGPSNWVLLSKVAAIICSVVILATMTVARNKLYDSAVAMWTDVVTSVESSERGSMWLGRAYANLGEAYGDMGEWEESLEALERARLQERFPPQVLLNQIRAYIALGRLEAADQCLDAALAALPNSAPLRQQAGIIAASKRDFTSAIAYFQEARTLAPYDVNLSFNLALALAQSGDRTKAMEIYQETLRLDPRHVQSRRRLIEMMLDSGDIKGADSLVKSLIAVDGKSNESAWLSGLVHYAASRYSQAIAEWLTLKDRFPPRYWVYLGNAHAKLGDLEAAVKSYENELDANPVNPEALLKLGTYFSQSHPEKSVLYFERLLALKPESSEIRLSLAVALLRAGATEQARGQLTQILQSRPDFLPAVELLERLSKASGG